MTAIFNVLGSIFGYILWAAFYLVRNFGVAIIIFTLLSKVILFPSSLKQQKQMAANSRLQAKQKELKEKYGNDKQKYNEEIQKLYERENTSPFSGCLTSLFPMFVMLGIYYSVVRPLTNTLHIAQDKIDALLGYVNQIPGISINSNALYSQIDIVRLFSNDTTYNMLTTNQNVTNILNGDEISKIKMLSGGFKIFGLDLLTTPNTQPLLSFIMLIPVLCLVTSIGSQLILMGMKGSPMQGQQGCMKGMFVVFPFITAWIAYTVPAAVGFYWICSTVFSFIQSLILYKMFSPQMITAKAEAQHIALLELQEAKVRYVPSVGAQPQNKQNNKKKK